MLVLISHINKATVLTDLFTMINCFGSKTIMSLSFFPNNSFLNFSASSLVDVFYTLEFLCLKRL